MKITPSDQYEEAKYPELQSVEKKIRLTGIPGKGTAAFAMAVATALSMTMCGATVGKVSGNATDQSQKTTGGISEETTDLALAGVATLQEESALAGVIAIEETALAGDVYAPEETTRDADRHIKPDARDDIELNIAGGKMVDDPTESAVADSAD